MNVENMNKKSSLKYVGFILILNVLADVLLVYLDESDYILLDGRGILLLFQYFAFIILIIKIVSNNIYKIFNSFTILILLLLYVFAVGLYSSNYIVTLNYFAKFLFGYFGLIVGFVLIDTHQKLTYIIRISIIVLIIYVSNFLLANLMGYGESTYKYQSISAGFVGVESYFQIIIIVLLYPLIQVININNKYKLLYKIFNTLAILMFLFVFRRTNLIALFIGALFFTFFSRRKLKSFFKYGMLILLLVIIFSYSFPSITENFTHRILQNNNFEQAGRFVENFMVLDTIKESFVTLIFGTGEMFNSQGKYGWGLNADLMLANRGIHNNYGRLLFGGGFIGLFLFIIFYINLYLKINKLRNYDRSVFSSIALTLLVVSIFIGFSSGITAISYNFLLLLYIGAYLRITSRIKLNDMSNFKDDSNY